MPPSGLIDRIDKPTGFDAEPRKWAPTRFPVCLGYVDALARVELEGRLRAVHLQVQTRVWVLELGQQAEGLTPRIEGNAGQVAVHNEDVVELVLRAEGEFLGDFAGVGLNGAQWDAVL